MNRKGRRRLYLHFVSPRYGAGVKSTSIVVVPSFMLLRLRWASAALETTAPIDIAPVALAVIASGLPGSVKAVDPSRSKPVGGRVHGALNVETW
jgi:hypothetical protein